MIKILLIVFFVVNALFWGLFPHSVHCSLVKSLTSVACPSHTIHLGMGCVCYGLALVVAQYSYIFGKHSH